MADPGQPAGPSASQSQLNVVSASSSSTLKGIIPEVSITVVRPPRKAHKTSIQPPENIPVVTEPINLPSVATVQEKKSGFHFPDLKKKSKLAPVPPAREKSSTLRSNFSYDTLKERADIWKKERNKKPARPPLPDKSIITVSDKPSVEVPQSPERQNSQLDSPDDQARPKICFTKEESDKVDRDILRLMNALEHNKYPFNRDKQFLFSKLRMTRWKQMGLLFAHQELDATNYFDTEQDKFGYDAISSQMGAMYNVIDSISRDVYELRELLYYERKDQVPHRRASTESRADQRSSSVGHKPTTFTTNLPSVKETPSKESATSHTVDKRRPIDLNLNTKTPKKPILKRANSAESFKSARSDESSSTLTSPTEGSSGK